MRTSVSGAEMGSSTSTAAAVITAQSTAVWPACGWTIWRSSMWAVPAVSRAASCQLTIRSHRMSRTSRVVSAGSGRLPERAGGACVLSGLPVVRTVRQ